MELCSAYSEFDLPDRKTKIRKGIILWCSWNFSRDCRMTWKIAAFRLSGVHITLYELNFEKKQFIVETIATDSRSSSISWMLREHVIVGLSPKGICFSFQGFFRTLASRMARCLIAMISASSYWSGDYSWTKWNFQPLLISSSWIKSMLSCSVFVGYYGTMKRLNCSGLRQY